ncbi:MAG TPA: hypothetical protein P5281_00565, partial [Anaerovoracaceae bacterium]|nr:hypothetical protein [Anaerovoracaceae bacterium]
TRRRQLILSQPTASFSESASKKSKAAGLIQTGGFCIKLAHAGIILYRCVYSFQWQQTACAKVSGHNWGC